MPLYLYPLTIALLFPQVTTNMSSPQLTLQAGQGMVAAPVQTPMQQGPLLTHVKTEDDKSTLVSVEDGRFY